MRHARPPDAAPRILKCPVTGCEVRISEDDLMAQVAHFREQEEAGDLGHIKLVQERKRGT